MEKIRPILTGLQRHHFWILSVIGIGVILYCWHVSVGEIDQQFRKNQAVVDLQFGKVNTLLNTTKRNFPNKEWAEKTKERSEEVIKNVKSAWDEVLKMQKPVYAWPEALGEEFAAEVDKPKWLPGMVEVYAENAPKEIEALRTMMGAAENPDAKGVIWNQENYDVLLGAFDPKRITNVNSCKVRQKSLWVYQSLASAIADTNTGDDFDPYNLPIHDIENIGVERMAVLAPSEWAIRGFSEMAVAPPPKAKKGEPAAQPSPPAAPADVKSFLDQINASDKATVPGFDRLAFRLRVRMDLAHLATLMTACANSKLPLDIHGLRFYRPDNLTDMTPVPKAKARGRFQIGNRNKPPEKKQEVKKKEPIADQRGTLVEIWGYAYFATAEEFNPPTATPAAGQAAAVDPQSNEPRDLTRRQTARS